LTNQVDADDETWTRPGLFHIYFNISSASTELANETNVNEAVKVSTTLPTPVRRGRAQLPVQVTTAAPTPAPVKNVLNIISAKLRLFKIGKEEVKKVRHEFDPKAIYAQYSISQANLTII